MLASYRVYVGRNTHTIDVHEISDLRRRFLASVQKLWPVATGSLSLRKSPCIRENCPACKSGRGHSSYALYGRHQGRRFSVYIPEELVPEVRSAVRNGRLLQDLINDAGVRYVRALKKNTPSKTRR